MPTQEDSNRNPDNRKPSQNSHTKTAHARRSEVIAQAHKAVMEAVREHPKTPAIHLAELVMHAADPEHAALQH